MSIEVNNLFKYYGQQAAVNDVSFSVKQGEILGFLGPNGAGKSTTMKIITGFIPSHSGEVTVCGLKVDVDNLEARKLIGYLPENNPLYLDMYVKEYLEFVGGIYKINKLKSRVNEMIDAVGLGIEQNKKIGALDVYDIYEKFNINMHIKLLEDALIIENYELLEETDLNKIGSSKNIKNFIKHNSDKIIRFYSDLFDKILK
jgi:ABC-type Na+ transport system ATPase subunit NatA